MKESKARIKIGLNKNSVYNEIEDIETEVGSDKIVVDVNDDNRNGFCEADNENEVKKMFSYKDCRQQVRKNFQSYLSYWYETQPSDINDYKEKIWEDLSEETKLMFLYDDTGSSMINAKNLKRMRNYYMSRTFKKSKEIAEKMNSKEEKKAKLPKIENKEKNNNIFSNENLLMSAIHSIRNYDEYNIALMYPLLRTLLMEDLVSHKIVIPGDEIQDYIDGYKLLYNPNKKMYNEFIKKKYLETEKSGYSANTDDLWENIKKRTEFFDINDPVIKLIDTKNEILYLNNGFEIPEDTIQALEDAKRLGIDPFSLIESEYNSKMIRILNEVGIELVMRQDPTLSLSDATIIFYQIAILLDYTDYYFMYKYCYGEK